MCWSRCSHSYTIRWRNSSTSFTFVLYTLSCIMIPQYNCIKNNLMIWNVNILNDLLCLWIVRQSGEKLAISVATALLVSRRHSGLRPVVLSIDTSQWRHENVTIYKEYLTHSKMNFTLLWSALTDCHLLHFVLRLMQIWQRNDEKCLSGCFYGPQCTTYLISLPKCSNKNNMLVENLRFFLSHRYLTSAWEWPH